MKRVDIEIDEITSCLRERATGRDIETEFSQASAADVAHLRKDGWKFDWRRELASGRYVFKLILENDTAIQGLVSMERDCENLFVFVHLAESAPDNVGDEGKMKGVGAHLFAIAAQLSMESGFDGFVSFESKTALIEHYREALGAVRIGSSARMYLNTESAERLIEKYMHGRRVLK